MSAFCFFSGFPLLWLASYFGSTEIANMLLKAGAKPDMKTAFGETAFIAAIRMNHIEVAKVLLPYSDINLRDENGFAPLSHAATSNLKLVSLLLDASVDLNPKTNDKMWTPLHIACINSKVDIIEKLLVSTTIHCL